MRDQEGGLPLAGFARGMKSRNYREESGAFGRIVHA